MKVVSRKLPRNRYKTQENSEIRLVFVFFRVELCSAHRNSLERNQERGISSQGSPGPLGKPAGAGVILWKGKKNYGRCTRGDEYSASVAVPGSESGHALQVRE